MPSSSNALCLTIGDPKGIGPEITAKFLASISLVQPLWVIGDLNELKKEARHLGIELPRHAEVTYISAVGNTSISQQPGAIAYESVRQAVTLIRQGKAKAMVTGPISKENLQHANIPYSGHTEMLQALANEFYDGHYQSDMLFVYQHFRMLLLTRHVALNDVSSTLSIPVIERSLLHLIAFLQQRCQIPQPKLCVLGVNPHAGEIGGTEEREILKPALANVSAKVGFPLPEPVPADAAFRHFDMNTLAYDAHVAAYHDQGLIPFKMIAGMDAVNITIGLPFLRTSVSHGTAPDIVGQGIATPQSLIAAYESARELSAHS